MDGIPHRAAVHPQIEADKAAFNLLGVGLDMKEAAGTGQFLQRLGVPVTPILQGFGLSAGLKEIERLVKAELFWHGGNPVARWNAESAEVRTDDEERIRLRKPLRDATGARVDGVAAAASAFRCIQLAEGGQPVVLEGSLSA